MYGRTVCAPAYEWQRLSPKYRSMRLLTTLIFVPILFTIPAIIVGVASGKWWISGVIWAVAAVILIIRLIFVPRQQLAFLGLCRTRR
jgi:hypothetical protein